MGELMANHHSNPDFFRNAGCERINKKAGLPVSGQTPVFHCARLEVRNGYQICLSENTDKNTVGKQNVDPLNRDRSNEYSTLLWQRIRDIEILLIEV